MINEEPSQEVTYEYLLWEICKSPEDASIHFILRDSKTLPVASLRPLRANLVPWAISSLSATFHDLGLFYAVLAPADPEGEHTALPVDSHYLTWGTGTIAALLGHRALASRNAQTPAQARHHTRLPAPLHRAGRRDRRPVA
ncbi:hypothetical protein [Phytomonospora endophytica]|uniref:hypothetical protein n=1 Tax=Phytomonospora endophytica TaxID=714109 RepID=UPI00161C3A03|nr:hypothetical protein [Phytomonospora endophytica]GIG65349.1 hypothetical protein Pen01_16440 [Phytomonospora endophytica]